MEKEILKLINEYDQICLFRHMFSDPDALASQFGLAQIIKDNFSNKQVRVLGENNLSLNGSLFPLMDDVDESFIKNSLAIILDTANTARIDDERFKLASKKIKIDHHPVVEKYADINYEDTNVCATSYLIAKLALNNDLKVSSLAATYLYAGIVGDTGRFLHNNTDYQTFELVTKLVGLKADIQKVYRLMYKKNINEIRLNGYILNNFKIIDNQVAYYILEPSEYEAIGVCFEKAKEYVNVLADIEDIKIWVGIVYSDETKFYHVSIRSKDIVINDIAQKMGGGGHKYASGIKASTLSRVQTILDLLKERALEHK